MKLDLEEIQKLFDKYGKDYDSEDPETKQAIALLAFAKEAKEALDRIDEIAFQNGYPSITKLTLSVLSKYFSGGGDEK